MIRLFTTLPYVLIALLSFSVQANEYVPPPTGPYQSSVVINEVERSLPNQTQIYKFPPADLIPPEPDLPVDRNQERTLGIEDKNRLFANEASPMLGAPPVSEQTLPSVPDGAFSKADPYSRGDGPAVSPNYYNYGVWGNQPYPYGQAYPYSYQYPYRYNQNGYNYSPFSTVPSPWSAMPMQKFFSGN